MAIPTVFNKDNTPLTLRVLTSGAVPLFDLDNTPRGASLIQLGATSVQMTSWTGDIGYFNGIVATQYGGYRNAPAAVGSGQTILTLRVDGFDGVSVQLNKANITIGAAETWSPTTLGTKISFSITPLGSTVPAVSFAIQPTVTAEDVRIQVFDVTAAALKQVSRGAADSGGAGFRVLRIPN